MAVDFDARKSTPAIENVMVRGNDQLMLTVWKHSVEAFLDKRHRNELAVPMDGQHRFLTREDKAWFHDPRLLLGRQLQAHKAVENLFVPGRYIAWDRVEIELFGS
jgi:hypothetical protein